MQEEQLKNLFKLMEQQLQMLQAISLKLDKVDQSIRELISNNIKYL